MSITSVSQFCKRGEETAREVYRSLFYCRIVPNHEDSLNYLVEHRKEQLILKGLHELNVKRQRLL